MPVFLYKSSYPHYINFLIFITFLECSNTELMFREYYLYPLGIEIFLFFGKLLEL